VGQIYIETDQNSVSVSEPKLTEFSFGYGFGYSVKASVTFGFQSKLLHPSPSIITTSAARTDMAGDGQTFPEQCQITQRSSGKPTSQKVGHVATKAYIQLAGCWWSIDDYARFHCPLIFTE